MYEVTGSIQIKLLILVVIVFKFKIENFSEIYFNLKGG